MLGSFNEKSVAKERFVSHQHQETADKCFKKLLQ